MHVFVTIVVLSTLLVRVSSADDDHVFSVTSFPDIENFYLDARLHNGGFALAKPMCRTTSGACRSQPKYNISICEKVLNSTHFKHRHIYPLDLQDPRVKTELRIFYAAIFEALYPTKRRSERSEVEGSVRGSERETSPQISEKETAGKRLEREASGPAGLEKETSGQGSERETLPQRSQAETEETQKSAEKGTKAESEIEIGQGVDENQLVYTLPYAEYYVRVFYDLVPEGTVLCLARTVKPYGVKAYFVSSAYHAHPEAPEDSKMYFVFRISRAHLVLDALAEEVAVAKNELTSVEKNYLKKRWLYNVKPTSKVYEDPLCSLSLSTKLRICASIFASKKYRDELQFVPTVDNVMETCHARDVFLYELSLRGGSLYGSEGLSEWMYGCRAREVDRKWHRIAQLFVSRSYDYRKSVFVYRLINDRFEMVDYFSNIHALYH